MAILRSRPPIRAVLFDLDGVLVDSFRYWFHLFNKTLRHFGHEPISPRTFKKSWGQSTAEDVRIFMPERSVDEVRAYFTHHQTDYIQYFRVNPSANRVLGQIRKRLTKLGCVTNSHRVITRAEMIATGLVGYFDVVLTADDVQQPKPHPEMLLTAGRRLKVSPEATVFVGDTRTEQRAARAARCQFIGYRLKTSGSIRRLEELLPRLA
jgi:HAD superfamily hydrolase (TIGR01509 family)